MTEARTKVLAVMEDFGGLAFQLGELAQMAGVGTGVIKGLVAQGAILEEEAPRDLPYPPLDPDRTGRPLTPAQAAGAACLVEGLRGGRYGTTLLRGVTGSGKTEVYLEAVAECLRLGRQALVLLPEIALTGEFLARVEERFGARPAEWHSGITQTERRRAWHAAASGDARLVVGARSSLFLPFRELGLIVVDEEHDTSYKQEEGVLYNARDMAVLRASIGGAQVVLASATPSLESWANAEAGKYARIDLADRFGPAVLPDMRALDMRGEDLRPAPLDLADAGPRRRGPAGAGRAGAAVPEPPRLCAGHRLPRLRPPDRLRALRRKDGRAPVPQAPDVPPVRRDDPDPGRLPELPCRGQARPRRPRRRASGRGGGGALPAGADRRSVVRPLRLGPGAEGPRGRDRGRRRRHRHRHPAGGQGPQLSAADAGRA